MWPIGVWRRRLRLRARVSLIVVTTLVVLLSGATAIRALEEWRAVMVEYERLGFFVARAIAALVVHEGGVTDSGRLQDLIARFGQHPGVADVLVVDRNFRIVADAHPAEVGLTYRGPDVVAAITEGREATEIKRYAGRPVLDVVVPIREDHRVTGALEVALELAPAEARLVAFLWRGAGLTLLVAAVTAAVLIVILSAVVVEPIAALARRVGRPAAPHGPARQPSDPARAAAASGGRGVLRRSLRRRGPLQGLQRPLRLCSR